MKFIASVLAIVFSSSAAFAQIKLPPERKVLSLPEIKIPAEAKESGLGGTVRVAVMVSNAGSVISVGDAFGPDNVCPSVSRPDVIALRDAARSIAAGAKFSPNFEAPQPIEQRVFLEVVFPGSSIPPRSNRSGEATYVGPVGEDKTTKENEKEVNRYTVNRDSEFTAANPPPGYKGPVNTTSSVSTYTGERRSISGGVLNGKARILPKPPYPAAARALGASGPVVVQVVIDESGSMFSAEAVSGHPLLRFAARNAACGAQFLPTLLEGNPVKVSGVIIYNFVAQ